MFFTQTFETEKEALEFKKMKRWRKCTISYSDYWKCWILSKNIKM